MGAKFVVMNISGADISLVVPAPHGSGRFGASILIDRSTSLDILPYAGSIVACRNIGEIISLKARGLIEIFEVES